MCTDMYVDTHYEIRHTWTRQLRKTTEQMKGKPRQKILFLAFPVYIWLFSALPTDWTFTMTPILTPYSIDSIQQSLTVTLKVI